MSSVSFAVPVEGPSASRFPHWPTSMPLSTGSAAQAYLSSWSSKAARRVPPQGLELSVYRIVQEALTNVVKHARSAPTWVRLQYGANELMVSVRNSSLGAARSVSEDNGNGTVDYRDCHGIIGMKERAATFGGTLTAQPLFDGGFEVRARLPLRQPA